MASCQRECDQVIEVRGHPSLLELSRAGHTAACVFELDDGQEHEQHCAVNADGDLACAAPLLAGHDDDDNDNDNDGIEDRQQVPRRRQVSRPVRIRIGAGCEAKLFYEVAAEQVPALQPDTVERVERRSCSALLDQTLLYQCVAELAGTFLMTLFIVGSVSSAVLAGAQAGLWEVGIVCGFGVMIAIMCTASISGAHLNPAMSLAFALLRPAEFALVKLLPYWAAQFLGAFVAGLANYALWRGVLADYVEVQRPELRRGLPGSVLTASAFGEYSPNPGFPFAGVVTPLAALFVEAFGTAVLAFVVFAVTHPRNRMIGNREFVPFIVGVTVAVLISLLGPLTQAGFNPARDFAPRLVACIFGWGAVAIPGPHNIFWIYIVGPLIGAPVGAALHELVVARGYASL